MRWKIEKHKCNDKRVVKKFLFLPKTLGNETRLWEFAEIEQRYAFYGWYNHKWAKE